MVWAPNTRVIEKSSHIELVHVDIEDILYSILSGSEPCVNIKIPFYQYGQPHVKEKTSYRPSFL